jgi:hypothetical protein
MINCEYAFKKNIPFVISIMCTKEGKLYSGESISKVIEDV